MTQQQESHLRVYENRSVLVISDGSTETFQEGPPNPAARTRLRQIEEAFQGGYLGNLIENLQRQETEPDPLDPEQLTLLGNLVGSITSEVGRGLIGLAVLLLAIKDISPDQSIRLHKGGRGDFSWQDGLPMRSLDSKYNTPTLRQYELLRLNNFGIFMTRSLAENYPYSRFYKAAIRGAKDECFTLIDWVESGQVAPRPMLEALIGMLINRSERFSELGDRTLVAVGELVGRNPDPAEIRRLITLHLANSTYGARLLEVAMHSLLQVLDDRGLLPGRLEPLSQMRSANKKHGNVADIEVVSEGSLRLRVLEAWDAKYGKPYLRDELEELNDKLEMHPETIEAGFVVDREPEVDGEIEARIEELESLHEVSIRILNFDEWVDAQVEHSGVDETTLMSEYLVAYAETLALRRQDRAPIDEPADRWLEDLLHQLQQTLGI